MLGYPIFLAMSFTPCLVIIIVPVLVASDIAFSSICPCPICMIILFFMFIFSAISASFVMSSFVTGFIFAFISMSHSSLFSSIIIVSAFFVFRNYFILDFLKSPDKNMASNSYSYKKRIVISLCWWFSWRRYILKIIGGIATSD